MKYSSENPPLVLQFGDEIIFKTPTKALTYMVRSCYLGNRSGSDNDEIFQLLGLHKGQAARRFYEYSDLGGDWPTFRDYDYKPVIRLVWFLLSMEIGPSDFPEADQVIGIEEKVEGVKNLCEWKVFGDDLPRILSLLLRANFFDHSPRELRERLQCITA